MRCVHVGPESGRGTIDGHASDDARHEPVLLAEVLEGLAQAGSGTIVDATVGLGGHAAALLERHPALRLVGLDVDPDALDRARARLAPWADRVTLVHGSYTDLGAHLAAVGVVSIDGILFDLGVSSLQLDTPERGFSFRFDAPLDMRFSRTGPTAADLLAHLEEEELMRVLADYGEEPRARRVARAIARARERAPIRTTGELHRIVRGALGPSRGRIDPATRTFQAMRIATNRELERLPGSLETAARTLGPLGRIAVIAFHSLEDRIVKRTFRRLSGRCVCPPGTHQCVCGPESLLDVVTRKPIEAGDDEVRRNPRARSARLRVAQRRSP